MSTDNYDETIMFPEEVQDELIALESMGYEFYYRKNESHIIDVSISITPGLPNDICRVFVRNPDTVSVRNPDTVADISVRNPDYLADYLAHTLDTVVADTFVEEINERNTGQKASSSKLGKDEGKEVKTLGKDLGRMSFDELYIPIGEITNLPEFHMSIAYNLEDQNWNPKYHTSSLKCDFLSDKQTKILQNKVLFEEDWNIITAVSTLEHEWCTTLREVEDNENNGCTVVEDRSQSSSSKSRTQANGTIINGKIIGTNDRKIDLSNLSNVNITRTPNDPTESFPILLETQEEALSLMYNDRKRKEYLWNRQEHDCLICGDTKSGFLMKKLRVCECVFCLECLYSMVKVHVNDGTINKINCLMGPSCPKIHLYDKDLTLDGTEVREIIEAHQELTKGYDSYYLKDTTEKDQKETLFEKDQKETLFEKYERLTLSKALDAMTDITHCPRCQTATIIAEKGYAECGKCHLQFCAVCFDIYHPVRDQCAVVDEQRDGGGFVVGVGVAKGNTSKFNPDNKTNTAEGMRKRQEEIKTLLKISECSRQCPWCGVFTEKNSGCNKMHCVNCRNYWCWQCNQAISKEESYGHFNNCVLWDRATIDAWEREMGIGDRLPEVMQIYGRPIRINREEDFAGGMAPRNNNNMMMAGVDCFASDHCGECKGRIRVPIRNNRKNNHWRCPYCHMNSCLQCKTVIRAKNVMSHFNTGKCQQWVRYDKNKG